MCRARAATIVSVLAAFHVCTVFDFLDCFEPKALRDTFMPFDHLLVGLERECFARQHGREGFAVDWISDVEFLQGILHKGYMLFWPQKQLDGLPGDEPDRLERRDRRRGIWSIVGRGIWLEGVQAAERFVDVGNRLSGHVKEQRVILPTNATIEGGQLGRLKISRVVGHNVFALSHNVSSILAGQSLRERESRSQRTMHAAMPLRRRSSFSVGHLFWWKR